MLDLRKFFKVAFVATIFCKIPSHVDAHCYNTDGSFAHGHWYPGCDPTISPAPTESPAPSPSPSAVPTDTQQPTSSVAPSSTPTNFPTTSKPSSSPSTAPTESPAPSPSPSMVPSAHPTTSVAPSNNPTNSPSESPSQSPSVSPSDAPSLSPSESPTSPLMLTVLDVDFTFDNVTDTMKEMGPLSISYFERESTFYLQDHVKEAPGVFKIEVNDVIVKKQEFVTRQINNNTTGTVTSLRSQPRPESQIDLIITVDLIVSVNLNRGEELKLNKFFKEFFDKPEHKSELSTMVKLDEVLPQEMFAQGDISTSDRSAKKSNGGTVAGAVLGLLAVIVGSVLIWMWVQTKRKPSTSGKLENLGTISRSFESEDRGVSVPKSLLKREIEHDDSNDQSDNSVNANMIRRKSSLTPLMYIPTLLPTESNIEVPDTPGTNFATNGWATPASNNGFATPANASGFMTPSSTTSRGAGGSVKIPKLLGGESSSDDENSPVQKAEKPLKATKKIPLPPKIKSPFRGNAKTDNQEHRSSSMGVVAGQNNMRPFDFWKNKETEAQRILRDLPTEIGGPSTDPKSPTRIRDAEFKSATGPRLTIDPSLDDLASLASRVATSSRKKRNSIRSPRPPPRSAKKKDHSVVDIVDEIAYLYSENDPKRYTNSSSSDA